MINVTRTFFPPFTDYVAQLERVWKNEWITNRGKLVVELEEKLKARLRLGHLLFVNNGTIALQIAIKALDLGGKKIITTPFSYVATTSSIVWEGCEPVFADIDPRTLTLDPSSVEKLIDKDTKAILATHVYGYPCDIVAIESIAKKYKLKVIYDAAHCFGVELRGKSLLAYGDISTCSFHATKLFHTGEGGAIVVNDAALENKVFYMHNFGHKGPEEFQGVGVNGKSSELHAAMGLAVLPYVDKIMERRCELSNLYDRLLAGLPLTRPTVPADVKYNYAYYPVVFDDERSMTKVKETLNAHDIFPRRYFFPSLSHLSYVKSTPTPVSDSIATRVLCLPLSYELRDDEVETIASAMRAARA